MFSITTQLFFFKHVMEAAVASSPSKPTEEQEVCELNSAVVFVVLFIRATDVNVITSYYVKRCSQSVRDCCPLKKCLTYTPSVLSSTIIYRLFQNPFPNIENMPFMKWMRVNFSRSRKTCPQCASLVIEEVTVKQEDGI